MWRFSSRSHLRIFYSSFGRKFSLRVCRIESVMLKPSEFWTWKSPASKFGCFNSKVKAVSMQENWEHTPEDKEVSFAVFPVACTNVSSQLNPDKDKFFNSHTKFQEFGGNPDSSPCFTFGASANQVSLSLAELHVPSRINPDRDKMFWSPISRINFPGGTITH